MFLEQFFHHIWMMTPIVLLLAFRLRTPFSSWETHNLWGTFIAVLMATMVFSISIAEIPFFPMWTGLGYDSALLILWVVYGQICANLGCLGGLTPRLEGFVYGALCGLWASVQAYKGEPHKLAMAVSGAFLGRIGIPILFLCDLYTLIPFSIISAGLLSIFVRIHEAKKAMNVPLWTTAGVTWLLAWVDPLIALSVGVMVGGFYSRSVHGWRSVFSFVLFGVCASSLLAGTGLLELCTRYMEGGVMGEQAGLSYDILMFGFLFSMISDPLVSSLSAQGIWDRALDVQHLSSVQGLYISSALGQVSFGFYAAGCIRKGKWLWLVLMLVGIVYMIFWEALL